MPRSFNTKKGYCSFRDLDGSAVYMVGGNIVKKAYLLQHSYKIIYEDTYFFEID